jgi:hypothetical protein
MGRGIRHKLFGGCATITVGKESGTSAPGTPSQSWPAIGHLASASLDRGSELG